MEGAFERSFDVDDQLGIHSSIIPEVGAGDAGVI
jgi:hypothetical protein